MSDGRPQVQIASALIRDGESLVMVYQGAPGEDRFWSIPSGRVEDGELVTEALAREVREETGLEVTDPGRIAFVLQIDNRRAEPLRHGRGPALGYVATVWTFDVAGWHGALAPEDPDGVVFDARFVAVEESLVHLDRLEWQSVTASYLRGEVAPGTVVLERWLTDRGRETIHTIAPWRSRS